MMTQEEIEQRFDESIAWLDANYQDAKPIKVDCAFGGHWTMPEDQEPDGGLLIMLRVAETGKTVCFQLDSFSSSMLENNLKGIREELQNLSSQTQEDLEIEPPTGILQ